MDRATTALAEYIQKKGFAISAIERNTEIPAQALYQSLRGNSVRPLRADEYLAICRFIEKEPLEFYRPDAQQQSTGA